jgi:hypothetical protein
MIFTNCLSKFLTRFLATNISTKFKDVDHQAGAHETYSMAVALNSSDVHATYVQQTFCSAHQTHIAVLIIHTCKIFINHGTQT